MKRRIIPLAATGVAAALALTGCGQAGQDATTEDGKTVLTMWTHSAGKPCRARRLRADHRRLQRLAGRVHRRERSVPAGGLQRRDRCGRGIRRPAVPPRPRRPDHAQLGVGGVPPAARAPDRDNRQPAAHCGRRLERRDLLRRILGCRALDLRAQVGPRRERDPHPIGRRAVDPGRVRLGPRHPEGCGLRDPDRHRRGGHRRMVAVRVLAHAAELRRRPHRPRHDALGRRRAQRPRGGRLGRVVPGSVRGRATPPTAGRSATRSSSTTTWHSATPACGTHSHPSKPSATTF